MHCFHKIIDSCAKCACVLAPADRNFHTQCTELIYKLGLKSWIIFNIIKTLHGYTGCVRIYTEIIHFDT